MFVQIIQGRVRDAVGTREAWNEWVEWQGEAPGWLGSTAGITDAHDFIAVVRFESAEAARASAARPDEGERWARVAENLDGETKTHDCDDAILIMQGGSNRAGFVQVIQGRTDNPDRLRSLTAEMSRALPTARPDVVGGTFALHGDGVFTQTMYFTSEVDARRREGRKVEGDAGAAMEAWQGLIRDVAYYDITDPWLAGP